MEPSEPSIHEAERLERRGRRFVALATLVGVGIVASTWVGLLTFLGANSTFDTVDDLRQRYIPDVKSAELDLPAISRLSEVYTSDGVLLGKLTERNSQPVPLDEIPEMVVNAALAAEDANFLEHPGIDHSAIVRALIADLRGSPRQGGSTITQQVIKQNFVGNEQTIERKISEAVHAIELEQRYTKEQILEFYLNSVYFGANAYGIKAAAQEYFGKDLDELTLAEAAALPAPIRNPSLYNLRRTNIEIPKRARDAVLDNMVEEGFITPEEAVAAKAEPLRTIPHTEFKELAPEVIIAAQREILSDRRYGLGDTFLQRKRSLFGCPASDTSCEGGGGLKISVTVDYRLQQEAVRILQAALPEDVDGPTGAIAMVDNRTGATMVMASGLGLVEDPIAGNLTYFDFAATGPGRSPGSSFKPFGLVAALESGIPLGSYWDTTSPQILDYGGPELWRCSNAGGGGGGIRSLESALVGSINAVFCQVAVRVGGDAIADVAHRMGIKSQIPEVPSIVLGPQSIRPLEMASAYSTLANYGWRVENYLIERIEDADGNIIYQHRVERQAVLDEALSAAVVRTMEKVVAGGTGKRARLPDGRPQAGKTGTHQEYRDAWFIGFIPQYTTSVWVGFPFEQRELVNITVSGKLERRAFGGTVAAPLWKQFMEFVTIGLPVDDFPPNPEGTSAYYRVPRTTVPDVLGLISKEATSELYQAGLNVEVELVDSLKPEDTVVEQEPIAESRISQGSTVIIQVSTGLPPTAPLLSLIDLAPGEIDGALAAFEEETGVLLNWVQAEQPVPDPGQVGLVVATNPAPGATVTHGDTVTVFVGVPQPEEGGGEEGGGGGG